MDNRIKVTITNGQARVNLPKNVALKLGLLKEDGEPGVGYLWLDIWPGFYFGMPGIRLIPEVGVVEGELVDGVSYPSEFLALRSDWAAFKSAMAQALKLYDEMVSKYGNGREIPETL